MSNVMQLTLYSHHYQYLFGYQRNKAHGSFTAGGERRRKNLGKAKLKPENGLSNQQATAGCQALLSRCPAHTTFSCFHDLPRDFQVQIMEVTALPLPSLQQ